MTRPKSYDSPLSSAEGETRKGRVERVERVLTSGLFESTRTITCIVVKFDLPEGERSLAFKCDNLPTSDHFLVRIGDDVLVTASDFEGTTTKASALTIIWEHPLLIQPEDVQLTEFGAVWRAVNVIVCAGATTYTRTVVACCLTTEFGIQHVVIFEGDADDFLHLPLCLPGYPVKLTFSPRHARYGAQVTLHAVVLDLSWAQPAQHDVIGSAAEMVVVPLAVLKPLYEWFYRREQQIT